MILMNVLCKPFALNFRFRKNKLTSQNVSSSSKFNIYNGKTKANIPTWHIGFYLAILPSSIILYESTKNKIKKPKK